VKTTYGDQTAEAELRRTNAWVDSTLIGKKFNVRLKDYQVVKGRLSQITEGGFTLVYDKDNQSRLVANEDVAVLSQSHISPLVYIGIGIGAIFGLHAKSMVVDEEISFVGTFNLDPRSANLNTECISIIHDSTISEKLFRVMAKELESENARHVTKDFNPDEEAGSGKRINLWFKRVVPKSIL